MIAWVFEPRSPCSFLAWSVTATPHCPAWFRKDPPQPQFCLTAARLPGKTRTRATSVLLSRRFGSGPKPMNSLSLCLQRILCGGWRELGNCLSESKRAPKERPRGWALSPAQRLSKLTVADGAPAFVSLIPFPPFCTYFIFPNWSVLLHLSLQLVKSQWFSGHGESWAGTS